VSTLKSISGSAYLQYEYTFTFFVKNILVSLKIDTFGANCVYTVYSAYLTVFASKKNSSTLRTWCEMAKWGPGFAKL
jgi:hypothetical protein